VDDVGIDIELLGNTVDDITRYNHASPRKVQLAELQATIL
jgi:hypothetical protein